MYTCQYATLLEITCHGSFVLSKFYVQSITCISDVHEGLGPELQCLLKVKEDLSNVLIFQHAILDAK